MRFLGVDLAWKASNPSGVALLGGQGFPLHLREVPRTLGSHAQVLEWIARHVAHHRAVVGIDAPLLGARITGGRRGCDDAISSAFGRFGAFTHSMPKHRSLQRFAGALTRIYGPEAFGPRCEPRSGAPAIREVYPNAFQVRLFDLDRMPPRPFVRYKKRRFGPNARWAEAGLGPFVDRCASEIGGRYVAPVGEGWARLLQGRPEPGMSAAELKSIEDRWDALLCALAVALEAYVPGSMRYYPEGPDAWRRGFILAPALGAPASIPDRKR
ncbi:MAG TPA: DUF429 domain-containing protein [Methylomirabilota bacterium]|nr:DUF429 domain-containing protein [Methylomirabilota bacterium]